MYYRPWKIQTLDDQQVQRLARELGLPLLLCRVLAARGYGEPNAARAVCEGENVLSDPMLLAGMSEAVERIHRAVDDGERIVVFGDYDVDGVTATAMLYTYLDSIGAEVYYKLPNREEDGYGLSVPAVEQMEEKGVQLIITVDNGISAAAAVDRAFELGIDVVVTDHHLPPEELPKAVAVVNPQLPYDTSPCKTLCGAGVAYKLICALEGASCEEMLPYYADLAAIGTVADIMVLEGENRTLVKAGLELMQDSERPGLRALASACGLDGKPLTAESISYAIAPKLNAAGRMKDATAALQLLLCEDEDEAEELAHNLIEQNNERRKTEQEIAAQIFDQIAQNSGYEKERMIVVWGKGWHQGVIGIVASRLVERFGKPAIVISIDENGDGKGSGRSIPGISLYDAIASASDHLLGFGGHAAAAGLSVREEKLEAFRAAVNAWAAEHHTIVHHAPIVIDSVLPPQLVSEEQVRALEMLAPFGNGNPAPLFLFQNALVEGVYAVGDGRHCRVKLRSGDCVLYAVLFGTSPAQLVYGAGANVDAVVSLSVYEGKNGPMVSARLVDLRPSQMNGSHTALAELCEAIQYGAKPTPQQCEQLLPQRMETAAVYRMITGSQAGIPAADLRPVFAKLGEEQAGKILISLTALEQLSLVECAVNGQGIAVWRAMPVTEKKDLSAAPVLRALTQGGQEQL